MTRAEGRTPPRVRQPDKGQRVEVGQKKERRGVGIPGQLETSFLIFLTLGSIKQSNTPISPFVKNNAPR